MESQRVIDRNLYSSERVVVLLPEAQQPNRDRTERSNWRQQSLPEGDDYNYSDISKNFIPTELPETYQTVREEGGFEKCVYVTDQAYEELIGLATHERTKDKWNKELMRRYLRYTWIRLMEQHRVLNVSAAHPQAADCKKTLESAGISETFAVFNTGLVDRNGEDIFAVLVQSTPGRNHEGPDPPYTLYQSNITLQHSGMRVTDNKQEFPLIEYLQRLLERMKVHPDDRAGNPKIYHNESRSLNSPLTYALEKSLKKASFFKPRDQNLLLDWTANIEWHESHIIDERLDRFLEAGVIDEHEAVIVDQQEKDRRTEETFNSLEHKGEKKFIKMFEDKTRARTRVFYFRREKFGMNACVLKLNQWIDDAKRRVQGTFTLAVPQVYYQLIGDKFTGRLQLLIPLFCGTSKAKLALSLDYDCTNDSNPHYRACTVLKIQWAYSNARLLAAPQATWILQDMD